MEWIFSLDRIEETAAAFIKAAGNTRVFAFHGPMGAGKTTFIQTLSTAWGVRHTVSSPTFSIIDVYKRQQLHLWLFTRRLFNHIEYTR